MQRLLCNETSSLFDSLLGWGDQHIRVAFVVMITDYSYFQDDIPINLWRDSGFYFLQVTASGFSSVLTWRAENCLQSRLDQAWNYHPANLINLKRGRIYTKVLQITHDLDGLGCRWTTVRKWAQTQLIRRTHGRRQQVHRNTRGLFFLHFTP